MLETIGLCDQAASFVENSALKIFLAAACNANEIRATREAGVKSYLFSFGMKKDHIFEKNADVLADPTCNVLVDSGAFSSWSRGMEIDVREYGEFCRKLASECRCGIRFVNLDVIPGRKGKRVTSAQREESARRGWENFLFLRDVMGLQVMPVFHQFEPFDWLERMASECDYIGISPSNDKKGTSERQTHLWLHRVFKTIGCEVRTHAFGVTNAEMLLSYPFYSADSTTWKSGAEWGKMMVPNGRMIGVSQLDRTSVVRHIGDRYLRLDKHLIPWLQSETYRLYMGAGAYLVLTGHATSVWEARGILWPQKFSDATGRGAVLDSSRFAESRPAVVESDAELVKEALGVRSKLKLSALVEGMRFREGLRGAKLAVWVAYCVSVNAKGMARLSMVDLKELTGNGEEAIGRARTWLKKNGWLVRMQTQALPENQGSDQNQRPKFIPHPDQSRSETGGSPDWHVPKISYRPFPSRAAVKATPGNHGADQERSSRQVGSIPEVEGRYGNEKKK